MRALVFAAVSSIALAACGMQGQDNEQDTDTVASANQGTDYGYETYGEDNLADTMASNDDRYMNEGDAADAGSDAQAADIPDPEDRPIMQAQVVLDRIGFGPGVIDGKMGMSTENALNGFQEANDLDVTGELDEATKQALAEWDRIPATRVVTIPASWSDAEYTDIPEDTAAKAELDRLGYKSLDERLAERFHTTIDVLKQLNPNGRPAGAGSETAGSSSASPAPEASATPSSTPSSTATRTASGASGQGDSFFKPGQQIRVPNIGGDRIAPGSIEDTSWQQTLASLGVGSDQPEVDRIVVSKAGKTLKAYQGEKLVALFTVSSGSSEFPLPLGEWDIVGEAYNPPYSYDPEVLSGGKEDGKTYKLPPGPNSPVGVVWIDLSKEHYGLHGTPDPETIGRAQSSGCVRLTNWDAARLAGMVSQSTQVIFEA
ncbi:L,D-transpeptidase family protein [Qipengyuania sp. XHP0207]|uniref:L,D-transpeptidase family protein n=1 Tax=Qipengyuania sp. XHP0207 TaxID=3038078 RepID=UPI00241C5794|nr:L,D-transpeptidase family protein [Qipengyuania sp. XHP0207]MDG5748513.1 L,D-transpeptidase family protein [Qipengyuania sp. XHP0207]